MIKGIIFDLDGVLIDSEPLHKEVIDSITCEYGHILTDCEYSSFVGKSDVVIWDYIISAFHLPESNDYFRKLFKQKWSEYLCMHKISPIEGTEKLLFDLFKKNIPLAVASSSSLMNISEVMRIFGFDKFVKCAVSGEEIHSSKPEPLIFLTAAEQINLSPEFCAVIEDSEAGIEAAKRAGMLCIAYRNIHSGTQKLDKADIICENFDQIYKYIFRRLIWHI